MMLRSHPPSQIKYRSICNISDGTLLVEKMQGGDSVLLFVSCELRAFADTRLGPDPATSGTSWEQGAGRRGMELGLLCSIKCC